MAERVTVHIKSRITDLVQAERYKASVKDGFFTDDSGEKQAVDSLGDACSEVYEYSAVGTISSEDGGLKISYSEPEGIGYDGCETTLILSESERGTVTLLRSGDVSTACRFDTTDKRQLCCYETPIIPLEFFVQTNKVHHTVSMDGGAILLDYFVEIRNVNTERIKMFIEVRRR